MSVASPSTKMPPDAKLAPARVSLLLKITALASRTLFLGVLIVLAIRVSAPQNETIWSVYDTPADLVRLALGLAVSVWIFVHLLTPPKDAHAYRTWAYLGMVLAPLAVVVAVVVW
jgi:TRAP-type C4-dicarboxylate transport system permease small subunit